MLITGGKAKGATCDSHDDHRIAMAAAVAALGASGKVSVLRIHIALLNHIPDFFDDLRNIGADDL